MVAGAGDVEQALRDWCERRRKIFYPKSDDLIDFELLSRRRTALKPVAFEFIEQRVAGILEREVHTHRAMEGGGTFHSLFEIHTEKETFVLKICLLEEPAFHFLNEAWAMDQLAERGLPSLEIEASRTVPYDSPFAFILMQKARGGTIKSVEDPNTQALQEPMLRDLGALTAAFHQIKTSGGGLLNPASPGAGLQKDWESYILLRLDEHIAVCEQIGAINSSEAGEIRARFERVPATESALLHGDLGHHNVFHDGDGITAIIDWEDALAGDPIFDVAYWGTFVRDEMREEFLEGYREGAKLHEDFEFRYWLYYLRIALSKAVHRHRFGAKERPGRPPASLRIQKALSKLREL